MTDFRCPSCNAKLAEVDESCPLVRVPCRRCGGVMREYRPMSDSRHWDYARVPEPAIRQMR